MNPALKGFLFYSLIVATIAIIAFIVAFDLAGTKWTWYLGCISLYASGVWIALLVAGFVRFRASAIRLLIGAPLALYYPSLILLAHVAYLWRRVG